ncbi:Rne/Rng family ribonuclease [Xanthobacter sp. KR7-225]|uniref:Rne/Rng family ribonuclease n=1 Tax=Xanthobacter sp. KR7-225 TaxID=3156613 RepID=UPI0032B39704
MANKMLIDATHPEETRVVVVRGNRVEEFDYESASRKQLRGNIYLAKVTRVEPSLQAAFVEYGGNRHGFLAFSEIHPDYYQIPVADRLALIEEEERAARLAEDEQDMRDRRRERGRPRRSAPDAAVTEEVEEAEIVVDGAPAAEGEEAPAAVASEAPAAPAAVESEDGFEAPRASGEVHDHPGSMADLVAPAEVAEAREALIEQTVEAEMGGPLPAPAEQSHAADEDELRREAAEGESHPAPILPEDDAPVAAARSDDEARAPADEDEDDEDSDVDQIDEEEEIENLGADEDALEEVPERAPQRRARSYKIQEVIRRRQVMLVQVVKEERGNKGAALTTYLSLAGRYSVLMPNTARGGGISRKITNAVDRKRLKEVVQDLEVPEGMGIILRTAGANRNKVEIKRDFEYLLRLWETVRELTLSSSAPSLVYEEGSLIKRAIRDLYNKDIDDIQVAGEDGYKEAKDFMRMLMPSHAKSVIPYRENQPIFARYGVEQQLDAMFSPVVQLKSGGYIVINPTEALVSIDVNSGRATREHHIEDTALKTNVEAAEEIARQLRLRDLAGLIVIDFIDMEEKRNNRSVERKLKDCLKNDRARIQIGRISHFGLLEMSRQRIRTGVLESSIEVCPHCGGTGHVRSAASVALQLLRALEEQLLRSTTHNLVARTRTEVALYVLNQKRAHLRDLEERFSVTLSISADDSVTGHQPFMIEKGEPAAPAPAAPRPSSVVQPDSILPDEDYLEDEDEEAPEEAAEAEPAEASDERTDDGARRKRRRRRRRRGERDETREARDGETRDGEADGDEDDEDAVAEGEDAEGDERAGEDQAEGAEAGEAEGRDDENGERRRRRRGRRGGRRNRRDGREGGEETAGEAGEGELGEEDAAAEAGAPEPVASPHEAEAPLEVRAGSAAETGFVTPHWAPPLAAAPAEAVTEAPARPAPSAPAASWAAEAPVAEEAEAAGKPRRRSTVREKAPIVLAGAVAEAATTAPAPTAPAQAIAPDTAATDAASEPEAAAPAAEDPREASPAAPSEPSKPRSGWWQRKLFGD